MTRDKLAYGARTGSFMKPDTFGIKTALYAPWVAELARWTPIWNRKRNTCQTVARGPPLIATCFDFRQDFHSDYEIVVFSSTFCSRWN